jgi:hypothetical protein
MPNERPERTELDSSTDTWSLGCPGALDCLGCAKCEPLTPASDKEQSR